MIVFCKVKPLFAKSQRIYTKKRHYWQTPSHIMACGRITAQEKRCRVGTVATLANRRLAKNAIGSAANTLCQ